LRIPLAGLALLAFLPSAVSGQVAGTEFQVNTYATSYQYGAFVASQPDGRFVVVWSSDGPDGGSFGVLAQLYDPTGAPDGGEFRVNTYTTSLQRLPTVAAAGNGSRATAALRVSPIARRMADEAGIDLAAMAGRGSGPEGRVVKADVERLISSGELTRPAAADAPPATESAPAEGEIRELTPMLKAVATRMTQSKQTVPHFYVESEIDMTRAMQLRAELNSGLADSGDKISVNDLIVRASALALIQHPQAHRSYVDGKHVYHTHANVGIAVALDDGLIVPVLNEADTKPVREISRETRDLAGRARAGKLKQREIEGATFSVSNLGMFDVANFEAIINPPESAIIAVGATADRPVVADGEIVVRKIMRVTLSCDHRACSGADGAKLLQTIKQLLQSPSLLLV